MKYLLFFSLLLASATGLAQGEKDAQYYYDLGLEKENEAELKKKGSLLGEAFPYFFKASELAQEGSELQLKAFYKSAFLYNYAKQSEQRLIVKRIIKGLQYLLKLDRKDLFAADYFFRTGLAYMSDYKPDSAIYAFSEARKVYQKHKNYIKASDCDHGIGDVYNNVLYEFNKAEDFYEKSLAIREQAGEDEVNLFLVSKLYSELAEVNRSQHDYEKALTYILKYISYTESRSKSYSEAHSILEVSYTQAADIYSETGSIAEAIDLYQKAISFNKKINKNKPDIFLAGHYYGLANVFQKAQELKSAIPYYTKAIDIYNDAPDHKSVLHIKSYESLAEVYLKLGDKRKSRSSFQKANRLLNQYGLQQSGQASELYRLIGNYFEADHQIDSALIYYQYSLKAATNDFKSLNWRDNPSLKRILLNDFAYEALLAKSILLSHQYEETEDVNYAIAALASFEIAEKLLVDSRARLDMDNAKWSFFDSNFILYQQALSLIYSMQNNYSSEELIHKAFYYMESSKSKMLTDALNEAEFARPLLNSDSLVQSLDIQRRNLYHLQHELKKEDISPDKQAVLRNLMMDADRKLQHSEDAIALKYPKYIKTKYRYEVPDLAKIKAFSKGQGATVLEFFWGPDEVFGLAVQGDLVVFKKIGATDGIQYKVNAVLNFLNSDRYSYTNEDVSNYENNAFNLYQLLLAPFESTIQRTDRLTVLPDGPIEQIPFEALVSKPYPSPNKSFASLNYLVRKYSISYSFSSSYLLNQDGRMIEDPRMLAFGFTQGGQFRSGGNDNSVLSSEQLPGSESELNAILNQFPKGDYVFGDQVTEELFKEKAPYFDLIHLAVHGEGDTEQQYSASLFFRDTALSKEDGKLYWYELFGLRLKAKLAVISSCESGIGKAYRGEGMLSMASAFAFAGCKNLVMGLWKVDDRVSADIMSGFYENLRSGDQVDVALTKGKRSYIERGDNLTASPKLWASLVCYGNEQIIEKKNNHVFYWLIFVAIILLLSIASYLKRKSLFSKQTLS